MGMIANVLCKVSILTVAAIAFDRHQAIINCLEYSTMHSTSYVVKGLIWIWIQSIGFSLPPVFGWSEYTYQRLSFMCTINWDTDLGYTLSVFVFCLIMPICVMSYCYIRIIQIARRHMRRIADLNTQIYRGEPVSHVDPRGALAMAMVDPIQKLSLFPQLAPEISVSPSGVHGAGNGSRDHQLDGEGDNISSTSATNYLGPNLKREARTTGRLLGLILALVVSWLPYFLTVLKGAFSERLGRVTSSGTSITITTWMFLVSSATNPIFYALGSKKFRNAIKRLWRKRRTIKRIFQNRSRTKENDTCPKVPSLQNNGHSRVIRSKSVPTATSKTPQQAEGDIDAAVPVQHLTPPIIILTPLEDASGRRVTTVALTQNKAPRRLPPIPGSRSRGPGDSGFELQEMGNSASNPLPSLEPIANGALSLRRIKSLD